MNKFALPMVVASLFCAGNSHARFVMDTDEVYNLSDFNDVPLSTDASSTGLTITDELADEGVTFSPFVIYNPDPWMFGAPSQVGNWTDDIHLEEFSIHFTSTVSDAGFVLWVAGDAAVTLTSYLNGVEVESTSFVNPSLDPPRFLGFFDTEIDEIKIHVGAERTIIDYAWFRLPCADADEDDVCDEADNCADDANPEQADGDADGAGDLCDACPYDAADDQDFDGVCGDVDLCPDTTLPETPSRGLRPNHYADVDGDGVFETLNGDSCYSLADTAGCSCQQILDVVGYGHGQYKFGCTSTTMESWATMVSQ